jgi:UDPglucose 6-dehydrogenase
MNDTPIRLAVVGTGYVGLTTGACFAHLGHHVVCGDIDERKVDMLNAGHIPIVEEGLETIVNDARAAGRL